MGPGHHRASVRVVARRLEQPWRGDRVVGPLDVGGGVVHQRMGGVGPVVAGSEAGCGSACSAIHRPHTVDGSRARHGNGRPPGAAVAKLVGVDAGSPGSGASALGACHPNPPRRRAVRASLAARNGVATQARSLAQGLLTATLVLPWFAYTFWRYGTLLPNSTLAKVNQNTLMVVGGGKSFVEQFLAYLTDSSPLAALAVGAALLVGLYVIFRLARQWWWLPVWVAGYLAVYVIMNVHPFPWYFAPPLTGCLVICALGLGALLGDGLAADGRQMRWPRAAIAVLCAVVIAAIYGRSAFAAGVQTRPGYLPEYRDVASWLATNTKRTGSCRDHRNRRARFPVRAADPRHDGTGERRDEGPPGGMGSDAGIRRVAV